MIFTILFSLVVIFGFIFILCIFAVLIQTSVTEIKESIKERDMFFIVFGVCAIGIEIILTIAVIWMGCDFIGALLNFF